MYISVDIGGTHTRIASSQDKKTILNKRKFRTSHSVAEQLDMLSKAAEEVLDGSKINAACIGVPGLIDQGSKTLKKIINVSELTALSFDDILPKSLFAEDSQLLVHNDAALAALSEATNGAGKDFERVAFLTISTSIGGACIYNKTLDHTQQFFEPGHMIISGENEAPGQHGVAGTFASLASGAAFFETYKIRPQDCGDPARWFAYSKKLAWGLHNVICMWAPDVIVLGGGVSNQLELFIEPLYNNLYGMQLFEIPPIVRANQVEDAGLLGGLLMLR